MWNVDIITTIVVTTVIILFREYNFHLIIYERIKQVKKFSFNRIEKEVGKLVKKIKKSDFSPNLIIGIAGGRLVGGSIVASLLASKKYLYENLLVLELPRKDGASVDWEKAKEIIKESVPQICCFFSDREQKILLVDDISQTGKTLQKTMEILKDEIKRNRKCRKIRNNLVIKVATIIVKKEAVEKLGENFWKDQFYCYYNVEKSVEMPWQI